MSDTCPKNGCDLRAGEIPREHLEKGYYGPWVPSDGPRFYSRMVGIETAGYGGVSFLHCPECGLTWSRWTGEIVPPDADLDTWRAR